MNKRKRPGFGFVIFVAVVGYFIYILMNQQSVLYAKQCQIDKINSKIEEEKENNRKLEEQKEKTNSDESIERIAREMLGMVKYGERVFEDINK